MLQIALAPAAVPRQQVGKGRRRFLIAAPQIRIQPDAPAGAPQQRSDLFSVMLVAGVGGYLLSAPPRPGAVDTEPMLEASLPDLSGVSRQIGHWKGKVLVVNFWATWCPPCLEEIPHFVRLQERFGDQGLQFVGIAITKLGRDHAACQINAV